MFTTHAGAGKFRSEEIGELETARDRFGDFGFEKHVGAADGGTSDSAESVNQGEGAAFGHGKFEAEMNDGVDGESLFDAVEEFVDAFAGERGNEDRGSFAGAGVGEGGFKFAALFGGEAVDFVEDADARAGKDAELIEDFVDIAIAFVMMDVGDVGDVEEDGGFLDFFKSRAEGVDEALGEFADETNGVGNKDATIRGQTNGADGGIESGEHTRRDEDIGAAEGVEEGGFSGVGVADQSQGAERDSVAGFATDGALLADFVDGLFYFADAIANTTAIGFQLFFTRAANTDAARSTAGTARAAATALAAEPGHLGSLPGETRKHVIELSEFDLKLTFAAASVAGKDVEDELGAIDDAALGDFFDVALLDGSEFAIEDDQGSVVGVGFGTNFVEFTAADKGGGVGGVTNLEERSGDVGTSAGS